MLLPNNSSIYLGIYLMLRLILEVARDRLGAQIQWRNHQRRCHADVQGVARNHEPTFA